MKIHVTVLGVAFLLTALTGCREEANRNSAEDELRFLTNPVPASDVAGRTELVMLDLLKTDRIFDIALQSASLQDWASFFSPDGVMIFPGVREGMGPEAIMDAIWEAAEAKSLTGLTWAPESARVSASGDMGYTEGNYRSTSVDSLGVPVFVTGRYVSIWSHNEDDTWTVDMTVGSPTSPPQPVPEPSLESQLNPDAWRGGTTGG